MDADLILIVVGASITAVDEMRDLLQIGGDHLEELRLHRYEETQERDRSCRWCLVWVNSSPNFLTTKPNFLDAETLDAGIFFIGTSLSGLD